MALMAAWLLWTLYSRPEDTPAASEDHYKHSLRTVCSSLGKQHSKQDNPAAIFSGERGFSRWLRRRPVTGANSPHLCVWRGGLELVHCHTPLLAVQLDFLVSWGGPFVL